MIEYEGATINTSWDTPEGSVVMVQACNRMGFDAMYSLGGGKMLLEGVIHYDGGASYYFSGRVFDIPNLFVPLTEERDDDI